MAQIRARYPEIWALCDQTNACFVHTPDPRAAMEMSTEEREAFWEECYRTPGFKIWQGNLRDVLVDHEANRLLSEFIAKKIRQRVNDPKIAEMLIPKDHGFGTRRVPQETHYFEVYNQPNVRLISMLETPVERITPTGVRTTDEDFEFELIVYATGFNAVTGALDAIDIRGTNGLALRERWKDGPESYMGVMVTGFPNMFMLLGPHATLGNIPRSIEFIAEWVAGLVEHLTANGHTLAAAQEKAERAWMDFVAEKAEGLLSNEVDSWMTGINLNVEGRQVRRLVRYSGPAPLFRDMCRKIAEDGYREMTLA